MAAGDRERWDARYRDGNHTSLQPASFIVSLDDVLPRKGSALDVAGGAGRHALWLAKRGLRVTIVDVSPVALEIAAERAAAAGVSLKTHCANLQSEPLPAGPWDVIVCHHYLERAIFSQLPRVLSHGGHFVFIQPTTTNLERHAKPSRRFLVLPDEAPKLVAPLRVIRHEQSWRDDRHEARLLAQSVQNGASAHTVPHADG